MTGAIIFIVCFVSYPLIAIGSFYAVKAVLINSEYKELTSIEEDFKKYTYTGLSDSEKLLKFHKDAYETAVSVVEHSDFYEMGLILCVCFWPVMMPLLILFYLGLQLIRLFPKTTSLNPAKRKIAKLEKAVSLEKTRQIAWEDTLKNAEAMGIDVKELKKLQ